MDRKGLTKKEQVKHIGFGYIVVIILLGIFTIVLVHGHRLHADLKQPTWAIAIAFILILPIFIPSLIRYLGPRITGIKIGNILELTLQQLQERTYPTNDLETTFLQRRIEVLSAPEYEATMSDTHHEIVRHIEIVKNNGYEVLVVDLKTGTTWVTPNLYFLALLLFRRTEVKQVAFVETRDNKDEFVGMCSPEEILETFGAAYPEYQQAANSICFPGLDSNIPVSIPGPPVFLGSFFTTLTQSWLQMNVQEGHKERVTSAVLNRIMGSKLHKENVEYKDDILLENYKYIVFSENNYIAVVRSNRLEMLINRDKISLKIAREIIMSPPK